MSTGFEAGQTLTTRYRRTFAEILVLGSIIQKLEGSEQKAFERWEKRSDISAVEQMKECRETLDKISNTDLHNFTGEFIRQRARRVGKQMTA